VLDVFRQREYANDLTTVNPDLLAELAAVLQGREGTVEVQWMRAHLSDAEVSSYGYSPSLVIGNFLAGVIAKEFTAI